MQKLYAHQQRFLDKNPDRAMLVWETGTGKTVTACVWRNNERRAHLKALVVAPKAIVEKWKRDLKDWNAEADVISTDAIKKTDLSPYDVLIVDEAQNFASPLFDKNRSQRSSALYSYVRLHTHCHILLLTATPVRSTPFNIHTLACYLRIFWDVQKFRDTFFYLTDMFGRMHWEKRKGWQKMIRPYIEEISDIVLMSDCVDVPVQHHQVEKLKWDNKQEMQLIEKYLEPSAEWHARHRLENGEKKTKKLAEIIDGYRKVIIVCHYRSQIEDYEQHFKDRQVFSLHGSTKDQDEVIRQAREADDCIFIIQASMGAGFDAGEFSVVVFASMSFRYVDYVQMKGRVKRINNLHENTFIHLIGGKCDQAVYDTIQENKDFDVHDYLATQLRLTGANTKDPKERGVIDTEDPRVVSGDIPF